MPSARCIASLYELHVQTSQRGGERFAALGSMTIALKAPHTNKKACCKPVFCFAESWLNVIWRACSSFFLRGCHIKPDSVHSITLGAGKLQLRFYIRAEMLNLRVVLQACRCCILTQCSRLRSGYEISSLYLWTELSSFRTWFRKSPADGAMGFFLAAEMLRS